MKRHACRSIIAGGFVVLASVVQAQAANGAAADSPPRTGPVGTNVQRISNTDDRGRDSARVFARLDTQRKGYLTRADAGADSYLDAHFDACDSDRDGQLSRSEVSACVRGEQR